MHETPETIAHLQRIIDRSAETAGPALARNFIGGGWKMSASEFVAFWGELRMAAISTTSRNHRVHSAPLDVRLVDGVFHAPAFPDAQRLRDHRANPRCSIVSWEDAYHAVIVYGDARIQEAAPGAMVSVTITPTRIYAIRAPAGHHAHTPAQPAP
ncbi:MAG: pyridoxamine 5'-phosphate oxidase family protein [Dehalococcoidia bacterium]